MAIKLRETVTFFFFVCLNVLDTHGNGWHAACFRPPRANEITLWSQSSPVTASIFTVITEAPSKCEGGALSAAAVMILFDYSVDHNAGQVV